MALFLDSIRKMLVNIRSIRFDKDVHKEFRRSGADRRRFPRVKCHHLVKCNLTTSYPQDWISNLKNISEGGAKLYSPVEMKHSDMSQVVINFPAIDRNISAVASVVWTTPVGRGVPGFHAGLMFLEVNQPDRNVIGDYVIHHLHQAD